MLNFTVPQKMLTDIGVGSIRIAYYAFPRDNLIYIQQSLWMTYKSKNVMIQTKKLVKTNLIAQI